MFNVLSCVLCHVLQWTTIPVIIMTSDDEVDTTDNMLALGADDCLKKPLGDGLLKYACCVFMRRVFYPTRTSFASSLA